MAAAGLEDVRARAATNPIWYQISLSVGVDRDIGVDKMRAIFDAGIRQAPGYAPLYRGMLRRLMPRWSGSYEQVDHFIEELSDKPGSPDRDVELYARLYWMYDSLEHDDIRLFDDSLAVWALMKKGFRRMVDHYPKSDLVLNGYVKFACLSEDAAAYRQLRPLLEHSLASTAWSMKTSLESCDAEYPPLHPPRLGPVASP
jgi:hypothetical protein